MKRNLIGFKIAKLLVVTCNHFTVFFLETKSNVEEKQGALTIL